MFRTMLFLHLLTAIFTVGPLAHAATTAARGLRTGDAHATAASARMTKTYSYASILAVFFGFGLMSMTHPRTGKVVATFSEPYIWGSTILWLVTVVLAIGVLVPALEKATTILEQRGDVSALRGKVAAVGGVIGLLLLAIVVLMVFQP